VLFALRPFRDCSLAPHEHDAKPAVHEQLATRVLVSLDANAVTGRVEVSANGLSGCSDTNYGNCRVVDRFDGSYGGVYELRDSAYKTAIYDVSDFDGEQRPSAIRRRHGGLSCSFC
jgi:hypothetical protein